MAMASALELPEAMVIGVIGVDSHCGEVDFVHWKISQRCRALMWFSNSLVRRAWHWKAIKCLSIFPDYCTGFEWSKLVVKELWFALRD